MFIDVNEIKDLINKYEKWLNRNMTEGRFVMLRVVDDLSRLIEEEEARMERMMNHMSEEDYFAEGGF